jgi:hypothetical protein
MEKAAQYAREALKKYEGKFLAQAFGPEIRNEIEAAFKAGHSTGMVDAHRKERIVPQQDNYERGLS